VAGDAREAAAFTMTKGARLSLNATLDSVRRKANPMFVSSNSVARTAAVRVMRTAGNCTSSTKSTSIP